MREKKIVEQSRMRKRAFRLTAYGCLVRLAAPPVPSLRDGSAHLRSEVETPEVETMPRLYGDSDKYGDQCGTAIVEAFHGAIRELVRRRWSR